ncbi:inositol-pentakisphosphate 2-kinase-like [Rhodamnia argentea]|uniref:Inositol-pentakisphosphate 2-kinase n=1 Tax=Rhodamnia argentea TaxID=178133 RepID=A0A8B8MTP0_9MYRT|nr:inositol-pentakisphosphate 2-kinase-like [Rhodamnia argentea]
MDLILEEKDAADWVYRGEGAANIVLAYTGTTPTLVGKVLRIQKAPENETHCSNGSLSFSKHELLLWKDFEELVQSPTKEIAAQQYAQHVISPLLGSKHVDAGIRVLVSREFLEEIERNIKSHRPDWRIDAAMVDTLKQSALLISDHSLFPHGIFKGNVSISVEIKPKCGFLPFSKYIARQNAIKRSTTRFKMHQVLKFRQQQIPNLSKYDPLDLFSGSKERIHEALKALCNNPQNNFRVFLDGSLILGGFGGVADNSTSATAEALEGVLKYVIEADDGLRMTSFLELLTETVFKSGVLDRLLDVQKLDNYDVEGAIHAYYNFISQPCSVCGGLGEDEVSPRATFLHALPPNESLEIVKNFLIATTAKDCSLMFCFRRREDGGSDSSYDMVYLESTNQVFDYKVHFIDLDLKPLEKMEHYYELDKKIVSAYTEALQNGQGTENDHTVKLYESTQ